MKKCRKLAKAQTKKYDLAWLDLARWQISGRAKAWAQTNSWLYSPCFIKAKFFPKILTPKNIWILTITNLEQCSVSDKRYINITKINNISFKRTNSTLNMTYKQNSLNFMVLSSKKNCKIIRLLLYRLLQVDRTAVPCQNCRDR